MTTRVTTEIRDGVLEITLNRPEARNALENSMINAIVTALRDAAHQPEVRAVLISGAGKAFCAGDDLKNMGTDAHPLHPNPFTEYAVGYPQIVRAAQELPKPIVCAIHGYAMGAGLEIALASDVIVAARGSLISLPFVKRGIAAGTVLLARAVNYHYAADLLFTGRMADIAELERAGAVAQLCEPDEVHRVARSRAVALAAGPTTVIGAMKRALHLGADSGQAAAFSMQVAATVESSLTEDFAEGKQAFAEKRDPEFSGK